MISKLEFIISPSIEESRNGLLPVSHAAVQAAGKALQSTGLYRPRLVVRTADNNERQHYLDAHTTPYFDVVAYIQAQLRDKEQYGIEHTSALTLVDAPLHVDEQSFRGLGAVVVDFSFGYSNRYFGESVVSTHEILKNSRRRFMSQNDKIGAVAYTLAHEAGHLFGLVDPRASRATTGNHCRKAECLMATTSTTKETIDKISTHGLRFCGNCSIDINT